MRRVPGLVSRVPGLLEPCLPSLCFFLWSIRVSGLHQGSGILGLLSPIIVFFLVVYQGSGIFGTLSPIIVFVLWSIRARDFIRVSGFLDFCFPSLCFLLVPGLVSRVPGLVSRVSGFLDFCLPSLCFFLWFIRAPGFLEPCLPSLCLFCGPSGRGTSSGFRDSWTFVSPSLCFFWFRDWSPEFQDLSPGFVSRVSGFLDFCLPSLCFFLWFIRAPGFLEPCLPSLCLFCGPSGRGTSSGFRDSWTFVSHHCVSSGSGTCLPSSRTCLPGFGTFGTLSPIIVFFLVVYEGSGIFGTLSPIIVFVLWSIRARDFIRVPGFLDFCLSSFPTAVCFWVSISGSRGLVPGMRSEFRGCAGFRDLSPGFRDFWNLVSHHCVSFYGPSGFRGFIRVPGFLDFCLPSLCFFLWFIRAPGFLEPCLPSLCLFCGPSGRGTSSGFRDSWTFVSHHCVSSGSGTCLPSSRTCLPGFGILDFCLPSLCFFLWFIRAPGFLEPCLPSLCLFCGPSGRGTSSGFRDSWTFVSHHWVSSGSGTCLPSSRTCLPGFGILGLLSPIIVFFLVVYQGSGIFRTLSPIIVFVLWSIRARDFIRVPGFLDFCFPSLCFFWFRDLSLEFRDLSPGFRDLSPGFRDFWNLASHHSAYD